MLDLAIVEFVAGIAQPPAHRFEHVRMQLVQHRERVIDPAGLNLAPPRARKSGDAIPHRLE
jgi:hypothetical protein